jgi:hypothetical protein
MTMKRWEYEIASYSSEQVIAVREQMSLPAGAEGKVMFCTDKGACFLDNIPNPNTKAIQQILNQRGADGWQLAGAVFRTDEMLCFWMREV